MDFKSTLNLPDPSFTIAMKADLAHREPEILARWQAQGIYHLVQKERENAPTFVLHDGPPYTNSPMHSGHALNNTLKDFVLKTRSMMGFRTPFVPGFDNHGLPIEQSAQKKFSDKKIRPTPDELRKACREHAQSIIDVQTQQRLRLGMFGYWENPYRTMDFNFEAAIIRLFGRLVEEGQIYRGLKPTLWSPSSRTALADTEVVYMDYVSRSIYVRFPLVSSPNEWEKELGDKVYAIIWTTTPWTIPANLALAFHPNLEYSAVRVGDATYIILKALLEKVAEKLGWSDHEEIAVFLGSSFENSEFKHPIFERASLGVLADYVTTEDGTGVVHTAPGHGREDFLTGQKYGLPVLCPVDEGGVLTGEAGEFAGVHFKACDVAVVDRLQEVGHLLLAEDYPHTYPHAERDEKPLIFRATEQWFISIDHNNLRSRLMEQIDNVKWHPDQAINRIKAMVGNRPDWCISRQRPWGVGIPVFYGKESGKPVLDPQLIEVVALLVEQNGSDAWFTTEAKDILPTGYKHPLTEETEFTKETDIFDVWFDSGSTWWSVLSGVAYDEWTAPFPADLYLEGSDQHRGWFNTSLVLSTIVTGEAPYKEVVTHGFVNDEQGRKLSKRLGNFVELQDICGKHGADVLRIWASSVNYEDEVGIGENLLKVAGETYRKIRNTLRFLLSNLEGFDPKEATPELLDLDEWILEQTDLLCKDVIASYKAYQFKNALGAIVSFCTNELSALYIDAIKDRMYCDGKDWPSRRSAQHACAEILRKLVKLVAPIIPFTAEEVYDKLPLTVKKESVHLELFEEPSPERLESIQASAFQVRMAKILKVRMDVFGALEVWRQQTGTKNSQDAVAFLKVPQQTIDQLEAIGIPELSNLLKLSWVNLEVGEFQVTFEPSPYPECERSRLRRPDVREVNGHWLSERDVRALGW